MAHELHRQPFLICKHRRQSARELPHIVGKYDFSLSVERLRSLEPL
jgi:hypothetical protein